MESQVEHRDHDVTGCKKDLRVEIPADEVEREIEALARKYARKVKVAGFRPGRYLWRSSSALRFRLRSEATTEMIQPLLEGAIDSYKLQPLTEPALKDLHGEEGTPLNFTLSFEVIPDLEIKDYRGSRSVRIPMRSGKRMSTRNGLLRERHAQYVPLEKVKFRTAI